MIEPKNIIRATFIVLDTTDKKTFQTALRRIYKGDGDDEDVQYVLDNVADIKVGHDPDVMRKSAQKRWSKSQ